jgi:hypothetical protein
VIPVHTLSDGVPIVPKGCSEGFWHFWHLITLGFSRNTRPHILNIGESALGGRTSRRDTLAKCPKESRHSDRKQGGSVQTLPPLLQTKFQQASRTRARLSPPMPPRTISAGVFISGSFPTFHAFCGPRTFRVEALLIILREKGNALMKFSQGFLTNPGDGGHRILQRMNSATGSSLQRRRSLGFG